MVSHTGTLRVISSVLIRGITELGSNRDHEGEGDTWLIEIRVVVRIWTIFYPCCANKFNTSILYILQEANDSVNVITVLVIFLFLTLISDNF